jgi:hypothetical protein
MSDTPAIEELKTRARLLRTASVRTDGGALRLRDGLHEAAREAGFQHWEHARRVLGGQAGPGDDMGTFWHAPACHSLLNAWFAQPGRAREAQAAQPGSFLLPYARQFVVAQDDYVRALGLDPADGAWAQVHRDLVAGYGSAAWSDLCVQRLRASRAGRGLSR